MNATRSLSIALPDKETEAETLSNQEVGTTEVHRHCI